MKTHIALNTLLYALTIGCYLFDSVFGALLQIGLGINQIITAIYLSQFADPKKGNGYKTLQLYWLSILAWLFLLATILFLEKTDKYFVAMLFIVPMIIATYFTIITFIIKKT